LNNLMTKWTLKIRFLFPATVIQS